VLAALIGIIGFFILWGLSRGTSGPARYGGAALDPIAAMIILGSPFLVLIPLYGVAGIADAFFWLRRARRDGSDPLEAASMFQFAAALSMGFGFAGTLIRLVAALAQGGEAPGGLAAQIAAALMGQLYGIFSAVIYIVLAAVISRRHGTAGDLVAMSRRGTSAAGLTVIAGTLTTLIAFGIIMLNAAPWR
jgi:hypothetical protein